MSLGVRLIHSLNLRTGSSLPHFFNAFEISQAQIDDISALVRLVNSAYRGDSSRAGWTTEADYLDGQRIDDDFLKARLLSQKSIILCLKSEQEILACLELTPQADDSSKVNLGMLSVNPKLQNNGLGAQLMKYAEDFVLNQLKAKKILMQVISIRSELIAYYERRGFLKTDLVEAFPYGDSRFGLPKRDDLQFILMEKTL